jgi:hypothetical protein
MSLGNAQISAIAGGSTYTLPDTYASTGVATKTIVSLTNATARPAI